MAAQPAVVRLPPFQAMPVAVITDETDPDLAEITTFRTAVLSWSTTVLANLSVLNPTHGFAEVLANVPAANAAVDVRIARLTEMRTYVTRLFPIYAAGYATFANALVGRAAAPPLHMLYVDPRTDYRIHSRGSPLLLLDTLFPYAPTMQPLTHSQTPNTKSVGHYNSWMETLACGGMCSSPSFVSTQCQSTSRIGQPSRMSSSPVGRTRMSETASTTTTITTITIHFSFPLHLPTMLPPLLDMDTALTPHPSTASARPGFA